jgi:hypothetical protein
LTEKQILDPAHVGNKAAKLSELDSFLKTEFAGVEVPDYSALEHQEVQSHLLKHYPEYNEDWDDFVRLKGEERGLSKEAEKALEKIQANIERAFSENVFTSVLASAMLLKYKDSGQVLMVRGSGAEDTAEMANAGGNYSAAGVAMESRAISAAMGKVVASYHSPLSMTQREIAGQNIKEKPITPVSTQVMIGEVDVKKPDENAIPYQGLPIRVKF